MKWLLLAIIVVATVLSDLLQSYEMKRSGEQSVNARGLARMLRLIVQRRYLLLSIVCMAASFFAFMALLQIAPLSFAVPASSFFGLFGVGGLQMPQDISLHSLRLGPHAEPRIDRT
jgi:uncharacterized membrane protein (UPF0182 family)